MNAEDILLWADGTWCFVEDAEEMSHMSDDYEVVPDGCDRWYQLTGFEIWS